MAVFGGVEREGMGPARPDGARPAPEGTGGPEAPPRWLVGDEARLWQAVLRLAVLLPDRLGRDLEATSGLSLGEYEVLAVLSEAPERRLRMAELAERAMVSRSRLSHVVDRLVEAGLVARQRCPSDRRGLFAVLSDEGLALVERTAPEHVASVRRYLVDRVDPVHHRVVTAAIEACVEALGAGDPRASPPCCGEGDEPDGTAPT